jgi:tetratricopeptide (TPR) repeat protein
VRGRLAVVLVLLAGCQAKGVEREADAAYAARRYGEAYAGYLRVADAEGARVWAKAGAAAAAAGHLDSAAAAYVRLAASDPTREPEALEGLERTGRLAERMANRPALRRVVLAMRDLAPGRPHGRLAYALMRNGRLDDAEAAQLLPAALAGAPDPDAFDALLLSYARALEGSGDCAGSAEAYRGFLRRNAQSGAAQGARERLARCAYVAGVAALEGGRSMEAERWLLIATADSGSPVGRRALLSLGDARLAQGDPIAAAIIWQRALRSDDGDSIGIEAARRIRALGVTDTAGDSARMEDE